MSQINEIRIPFDEFEVIFRLSRFFKLSTSKDKKTNSTEFLQAVWQMYIIHTFASHIVFEQSVPQISWHWWMPQDSIRSHGMLQTTASMFWEHGSLVVWPHGRALATSTSHFTTRWPFITSVALQQGRSFLWSHPGNWVTSKLSQTTSLTAK